MADLGAIGTLDPYPANVGRSLNPYVQSPTPLTELNIAPASAGLLSQVGPGYLRCLITAPFGPRDPLLLAFADPAEVTAHLLRSGRVETLGNPAPPSQMQGRWGAYTCLVPVAPGARTIAIDVFIDHHAKPHAFMHPPGEQILAGMVPFPRLTVKSNHEVGLLVDLVADAAAVHDWQTLSVGFTATRAGAVEVIREKRYKGMDDVVFWDNLRVT